MEWCLLKHRENFTFTLISSWIQRCKATEYATIRSTMVYPKVSGLSHYQMNNNNKHSLRNNAKGYGGKTR